MDICSAWDTMDKAERFRKAIEFIASHVKRKDGAFGEKNVYVGEFGFPETPSSPGKVMERCETVLSVAREWKCPVAIYWQLYCKESINPQGKQPGGFKGFWLKRPDGSSSPAKALLSWQGGDFAAVSVRSRHPFKLDFSRCLKAFGNNRRKLLPPFSFHKHEKISG